MANIKSETVEEVDYVDAETYGKKLEDFKAQACTNLQSLVFYEFCFLTARDSYHAAAILKECPKDKNGRQQLFPIPQQNDIKQIEATICHKCKRNVATGRFLLHYQKCSGQKRQASINVSLKEKVQTKRKKKSKKVS
uniref:SAGA-associated factor 11 n=1 Tax=Panagrolaimus superbus TaxID=310955 RepID=A0A914YUC1_9BILA